MLGKLSMPEFIPLCPRCILRMKLVETSRHPSVGVLSRYKCENCRRESRVITAGSKQISDKSSNVKHSIVVNGHKTSISLEGTFWLSIKEIAAASGTTLGKLISAIDRKRTKVNLSSAIRVFVLEYYRDRARIDGGRDRGQTTMGR